MKKSSRTRKLMKSLVLSLALAAVGFAGAAFAAPSDANAAAVMASQMKNSSITELTNDTRVFKVDKKIQTKMVRFQNRYGIEVIQRSLRRSERTIVRSVCPGDGKTGICDSSL